VRIVDDLRECTCFICVKDGDKVRPGGTAFWVKYPITPSRNVRYLVTAGHCVKAAVDKLGALYARVNSKDGNCELIQLPADGWVFSDKAAVDLAVFQWPKDKWDRFGLGAIDLRSAAYRANVAASSIGIGNEVLVIACFAFTMGLKRIFQWSVTVSFPQCPRSLFTTPQRTNHTTLVLLKFSRLVD
jgi:hypothetical protein